MVLPSDAVCAAGTGVTLRYFRGLTALIGRFQHTIDGWDDQLAAAQPDHSSASQGVQCGGSGFASGADQAGQFALRERDRIFRSVRPCAEHLGEVRHVVENAIFDIAQAKQLNLFFQLALARRELTGNLTPQLGMLIASPKE